MAWVDVKTGRFHHTNEFVHRLPGRTKYSTIKLTRTLNPLSAQVAAWISSAKGPAAGHTAEIRVLDTEGVTVTLSAGVAASKAGEAFDHAALFAACDAALYAAKREGRNRAFAGHGRPALTAA